AAVRVPPGEPRTLAEVLATTRAIRAGSARRAQPRRADPRSGLESRAAALDPPDDLVARHDRRRDEWKVALDDVEVGAADPACGHAHEHLSDPWRRRKTLFA